MLNDRGRVWLAGAGLLVMIAGAAVAGASVVGVARSVMSVGGKVVDGARTGGSGFAERMDLAQRRVDGRSLFFTPPRPRPPAPPVVRVDPLPRGPTIPTRYGGPQVIAILNDIVWFDDGSKLAPRPRAEFEGDIAGEVGGNGAEDRNGGMGGLSGLSVLSVDPPWSVRVWWSGREWTLDLFERNVLVPMFDAPVRAGTNDGTNVPTGNGSDGDVSGGVGSDGDGGLLPNMHDGSLIPDEPDDVPAGLGDGVGDGVGVGVGTTPSMPGEASGSEEPDDA